MNTATTERPPKPTALTVDPNGIPPELKERRQWLLWKYTWKAKEQKWDKPPKQVNGKPASDTNPATWNTFDNVWAAYQRGGWDGIGFVFTTDDHYIFIDLDGCRDSDTGSIAPWSAALRAKFKGSAPDPIKIISQMRTYAELSPSDKGFHLFCAGELPGDRNKIGGKGHGCADGLELYQTARYSTITGHLVPGCLPSIAEANGELHDLYTQVFGDKQRPTTDPAPITGGSCNFDDSKIIEMAKAAKNGDKFCRLWNGDTTGFSSASEADLALANMLAFWTGPDSSRIESLMCQSGLKRPKWFEHKTYLDDTITKALADRTDFYRSDAGAGSKTKMSTRSKAMRTIIVGTDEPRVVDEAIAALGTCENIYQRGGVLVQVVEGAEPLKGIARPKDAPRIAAMRFARIRELLADAAAWFRPAGEGELEPCHPPDWTVKALDARGQWSGIRRLEAVVESPILRADGSVLQTAGYDEATGIIFRPQGVFPAIPEMPSQTDAIRARDILLRVVEDFPFATDAHKAAWLAGVLTPLARYAFHGPAPLFLYDANVRGCGKSLLTDLTSFITAGRAMARMSLPRDDDETRKRITALAMAGEPEILIDNLPASGFGSPSLDAALTATSWSDRILGQTAMASGIPLYAVWYATGNNVILVGDTARRVVHIRLESPEENPEERADFHHPDLLAWVRQERPRLTAAAVTILAAYCAAGRPDMQLMPWGSFEDWSALVRQVLVWVGLPDPGSTRTELVGQSDREAVALRQLIAGWEEMDAAGVGMTVAAVVRELGEHPTRYDALRSALYELAPPRDGKTLNPRSVGMKLHHLLHRVVGGKFLDRREARQGAIWVVCGRDICGTSTTSGTILDSARAGAHARARENVEATGNSPASPASPTVDPSDCFHQDVEETPTHDGYVNLTCRTCGKNLDCRKMEPVA
jgi:hypothetical protein